VYAAAMAAATTERTGFRQPLTLSAGGLEVAFEWAGDRWRHRVTHGGRLVAESVEGPGPDGDPRWPASPAFQEVSAAEAAGRRVVLAVGAAGRSHYSASFAADPAAADTVLVDVACRFQEPPIRLGTTYRTAAGVLVRVAAEAGPPPRTTRWCYRVGPGGVAPDGAAEAALAGPG
jgi:hypothetical protein